MSVLVRAASLRAYVSWMQRERLLEAVRARLPPRTAALIRELPPSSSWVEWEDMVAILSAIDAIGGEAAVLRMSREQLRAALLPPLQPVIAAVLRFFNTSPAKVLRLYNELILTSVKGMDFRYREVSERSGVMEVSYAVETEVPSCMFVSCRASIELVVELCGVTGSVSEPERLGPARAQFAVSW